MIVRYHPNLNGATPQLLAISRRGDTIKQDKTRG